MTFLTKCIETVKALYRSYWAWTLAFDYKDSCEL